MFLQWCLSPYYHILTLQQQSLSNIHPWHSHNGNHLGNNVITSINDTMMLLLVLDLEVVLAFILAIKLHQHLSLQRSHIKGLCNVATSQISAMQPYQESLPWSHTSFCPCTEAILTLAFTWSCIHIFLYTEIVSPLIFVMKLRQHLHLHWSITITLTTEAIFSLAFDMKSHHHLPL